MKRMSQNIAWMKPIPAHPPLIAAISGLRRSSVTVNGIRSL
jgi:hypothetical protein